MNDGEARPEPSLDFFDEVRVLKEVNGDGVARLTRKQRQRLKRKMKGGS